MLIYISRQTFPKHDYNTMKKCTEPMKKFTYVSMHHVKYIVEEETRHSKSLQICDTTCHPSDSILFGSFQTDSDLFSSFQEQISGPFLLENQFKLLHTLVQTAFYMEDPSKHYIFVSQNELFQKNPDLNSIPPYQIGNSYEM